MTCPELTVITSVTFALLTTVVSVQLAGFGGRCLVRVEERLGETGQACSLLPLRAVLCDSYGPGTGE